MVWWETSIRTVWDPVARSLTNHGHMWHGSTHLQYCEGWAHPEHFVIAVRHAWILDTRTNIVIERTWPAGTGQLPAIADYTDQLTRAR